MSKPNNSTIICLIIATFLAGLAGYALFEWINAYFHLPAWVFFLVYSLTIPTVGFYKAIYWGYWMAKIEETSNE